MRLHLTKLALLFSLFSFSQEQPERFGIDSSFGLPKGLKVGDSAPQFVGEDQNGNRVELNELLKNGKVVVMFYRGYWCPVCNRYLSQFQESLNLITDKGAAVIAITPEENDGVEKTVSKNKLSFSVLSDRNYEIMDKYGVRFLVTESYANKINNSLNANIAATNGDEKPYLPIPATYIIGTNGKIEKAFFDQNYKNRPTAEEIAKYL